jgi:hypothetical protein
MNKLFILKGENCEWLYVNGILDNEDECIEIHHIESLTPIERIDYAYLIKHIANKIELYIKDLPLKLKDIPEEWLTDSLRDR